MSSFPQIGIMYQDRADVHLQDKSELPDFIYIIMVASVKAVWRCCILLSKILLLICKAVADLCGTTHVFEFRIFANIRYRRGPVEMAGICKLKDYLDTVINSDHEIVEEKEILTSNNDNCEIKSAKHFEEFKYSDKDAMESILRLKKMKKNDLKGSCPQTNLYLTRKERPNHYNIKEYRPRTPKKHSTTVYQELKDLTEEVNKYVYSKTKMSDRPRFERNMVCQELGDFAKAVRLLKVPIVKNSQAKINITDNRRSYIAQQAHIIPTFNKKMFPRTAPYFFSTANMHPATSNFWLGHNAIRTKRWMESKMLEKNAVSAHWAEKEPDKLAGQLDLEKFLDTCILDIFCNFYQVQLEISKKMKASNLLGCKLGYRPDWDVLSVIIGLK